MKQIYLREKRNEAINEDAEDFIFGCPSVSEDFTNMDIDEHSMFFMQLKLDEKNLEGLPKKGNLYIFFDTKPFFLEGKRDEAAFVPYLYYSTKEIEYVLDDYNDAFQVTLFESKTQYEIEKCYKKEAKLQLCGIPALFDETWNEEKVAIITISRKSQIINFFEHVVNDPKQVVISIDKNVEIKENEWIKADLIISK